MNNKNGISVISLIITIIVLILITSITLYTGGNMVDQSRIRAAKDRLEMVANAIVSHEEELGFKSIVIGTEEEGYRLLGERDYELMGLSDLANNDQIPPIYIKKSGDNFYGKKEYNLKTPKSIKTNQKYKESDYVYLTHTFFDGTYRENLKVEFDLAKGVNRPLLINGMLPVKTYYDDTDNVSSNPVIDIYNEDWYDYSSASPNWANATLDNVYYVWIPRFAFKVEDFYTGQDFVNIPASAIKIVFLKGTSDYMSNDEALPAGYQVHPAFQFSKDGEIVDLPGFWVAKYNIDDSVKYLYGGDTQSALEEVSIDNLHSVYKNDIESHLLKNTEWSAIAYLSFATAGLSDPGASLPYNPSAVFELNVPQFVAGVYEAKYDDIPNDYASDFDVYAPSGDILLYTNYVGNDKQQMIHGDAMLETSKRNSENSSWFRGKSIKISSSAPFIIRGVDDYLFSYSASANPANEELSFRNVLIIPTVS